MAKAQKIKCCDIKDTNDSDATLVIKTLIDKNQIKFQKGLFHRLDVLLEVLIDLRNMYNSGSDK